MGNYLTAQAILGVVLAALVLILAWWYRSDTRRVLRELEDDRAAFKKRRQEIQVEIDRGANRTDRPIV